MRRKSIHYYDRDRRKGRTYSIVMHLVLLVVMIFGLPSFMMPAPPPEPMAVSVEILPVSEMSNVKPSQQQQQQEAPKPEEAKQEPKEAPPIKVADAVPLPAEKPAEKLKKEEKKPPKKEVKKPKEDDLAAVLRAVKETAQKEKKDEKKQQEADKDNKTHSTHYDAGLPMSLSEIDAIKNQIRNCWNVPAGARNAQDLIVVLRLQLAADGAVLKVDLADQSKARYDSDTFFRAAADSARRAVQECSPLKNLPQDKYATWRDMEMTFDPKEMLF